MRVDEVNLRALPHRLAAQLAVRDRAFSRVKTKSAHAPQAVRLNGHEIVTNSWEL
jgi:hypothetical protein